MKEWYFQDGPGFNHQNRVSSMHESLLLHKVQYWHLTYLDVLPNTGMKEKLDGATLENRLKGYIFSILTQASKLSAMATIDQIIEQIVKGM